MNGLFILLRGLTCVASLSSLILLGLVLFLRDAASTAKQGVQALGYATTLFATAFTKGTAPEETEWQVSPWQMMIGLLSLAMLASVFTPATRWFLHLVGVLAAIVMSGYARMIFTGASLEIVCLPFLAVWFGYYAMCLCWHVPAPLR